MLEELKISSSLQTISFNSFLTWSLSSISFSMRTSTSSPSRLPISSIIWLSRPFNESIFSFSVCSDCFIYCLSSSALPSANLCLILFVSFVAELLCPVFFVSSQSLPFRPWWTTFSVLTGLVNSIRLEGPLCSGISTFTTFTIRALYNLFPTFHLWRTRSTINVHSTTTFHNPPCLLLSLSYIQQIQF